MRNLKAVVHHGRASEWVCRGILCFVVSHQVRRSIDESGLPLHPQSKGILSFCLSLQQENPRSLLLPHPSLHKLLYLAIQRISNDTLHRQRYLSRTPLPTYFFSLCTYPFLLFPCSFSPSYESKTGLSLIYFCLCIYIVPIDVCLPSFLHTALSLPMYYSLLRTTDDSPLYISIYLYAILATLYTCLPIYFSIYPFIDTSLPMHI